MAGLLDPDFVIGRDGMPRRIEQPTDGLLATTAPTWADAWQFNTQAAGDWIDKQRAISEERGLWNPETGLPTAAGVVDAAGQTAQGILMGSTAPKGIRAYHGSPHDFEAFDTSKIGTGEGAQAYGHGLYFAEKEGIARGYRDSLSVAKTPEEFAAAYLHEFGGDRAAAIAQMTDHAVNGGVGLSGAEAQALRGGLQLLKGGAPIAPKPPGSMYEVELKADAEHFLDWDKRLSEQHPRVQEALRATGAVPDPIEVNAAGHFGYSLNEFKTLTPEYQRELIAKLPANHANYAGDPRGSEIIEASKRRDPAAMSQQLREAGIPGIRYLDASSRRAGEGTSNYVVFDASQIAILRKYLALLTAGGAGGMAAIGGRE